MKHLQRVLSILLLTSTALAFGQTGTTQSTSPTEPEPKTVSVTLPTTAFSYSNGKARIVYGARISKILGSYEIFVTEDGKTYYEVHDLGLSAGRVTTQYFEEFGTPRFKATSWSAENDRITFNKVVYQRSACPKEIKAVRLPNIRTLKMLFKLDGQDSYVCVTTDRYHDFYTTWHVAVGPLGRMKLQTGIDADVNTSTITTHAGALIVPPEGKLSWLGKSLTREKIDQYSLTEQGMTVILKKN